MNTYFHHRINPFAADDVLSCAACDELLAAYLDAELANRNVKHEYATVWRHLQTCRCCAAYHDWLYRVFRQSPAPVAAARTYRRHEHGAFSPVRPAEPMYSALTPAWQTSLRSALLGEPLLLRIAFTPAYLHDLHQQLTQDGLCDTPAAMPATVAPPTPRLLAKQLVAVAEENLLIKIIAYPLSRRLRLVRLQAILSAMSRFPGALRAQLQWGRLVRLVSVTASGEADLGVVSLAPERRSEAAVPRPADRFVVTIEAMP